MQYIAYDPYCPPAIAEKYNVKLVSIEEVLKRSDFVSIHCKVTNETIGLIGAAQFKMMRKEAYLINTARGSIIRQKDLVEALQAGEIAGAVLDVFWREPLPANHPMLNMRNVLITPHIAGASYDVPTCHSRMVMRDVLHYINKEDMEHVYNRNLLSK
jgi:D-3-phosphoglycerate dehydrogenase